MILRGSVPSAVLGMDTGITVITPGTYHLSEALQDGEKPYKVAYLLHGLYGNNSSWADYTMLPAYAGDHHMIFIMPEAARSFYTDMAYGQAYFTYISEELPAICRKTFQISSKREDTFVIGGSAGGYGALRLGLTFPERFGCIMAFSSAGLFMEENVRDVKANWSGRSLKDADEKTCLMLRDMEAAFGPNLICRPEDSLIQLAGRTAGEGRSFPKIYMSCGDQDPYLEENRRFKRILEALPGISFFYEEIPGCHDWHYFDKALQNSLDRFCRE